MTARIDVAPEILAAVAEVHEMAVRARLLVDDARSADAPPRALGSLLEQLSARTDQVCSVYAPDGEVDDAQPVAFDDPGTGWDFDPWVEEKTRAMATSARRAVEQWATIMHDVDTDDPSWSDFVAGGDPSDLGHTPVNRLSYFEFCLGQVEAKAKAVFQMLDERLTAHAPGRGTGLPTRP